MGTAYTERDPLKYYVDGIFAEGTLNLVFGAPGSLKSMVLADMCMCVAMGLPWLPYAAPSMVDWGQAPLGSIATVQAPIFWADFDNGARRTDERFDALGKTHGIPRDAPIRYVSMADPWLNAADPWHMLELAGMINEMGAKVVVIDNLGLVTGNTEENSAEMTIIMGNFRRLAEATRAAIIVIHHQRKGGTGTQGRRGDSIRGHSSIEAALDLALLVEREDGTNSITMTPTKVRGADFSPIGGTFSYEHRPGTKDLAEARFWGKAPEPSENDLIDEAIIDALYEMGESNKTSLKDAAKKLLGDGKGDKKISARIDELARVGKVREVDNGQGKSKMYSLKDEVQA